MRLKRQVRGCGPTGGILILGEAPGREEVSAGVPFVGMAGRTLRRKLRECGLDPEEVRFENVIEYQIKDNNIAPYYQDSHKYKPTDELREWQHDCIERIVSCRPKVVIAAGDTALRALCFAQHWPISKSHCYVLHHHKLNNGIPIIPCYHPQFVNYSPEYGIWLNVAINKAIMLRDGVESVLDESGYMETPSHGEVISFIEAAKKADKLSIDIEKERTSDKLTAIGIATAPEKAISIPWGCWTTKQEREIRTELRSLFSGPALKIFQNFCFDCLTLWKHDLEVSGPFADTMELSVLLNPQLKKSLGDIGRLYLFVEPWKSKAAWDRSVRTKEDFGLYNCRDAGYTFRLYEDMIDGLRQEGLLDYYNTYREPLYEKVLPICYRGWRVDKDAISSLKDDLEKELEPLRFSLNRIAGPLLPLGKRKKKMRNPERDKPSGRVVTAEEWKKASKADKAKFIRDRKTGELLEKAFKVVVEDVEREFNPNSPVQIQDILGEMKIKVKSTRDDLLADLVRRYPDNQFLKLLRLYRKAEKMRSTYANVRLEDDGRMRFQINVAGTATGRFSSSQTPWDTGLNSQNLPKRFRHVVVPEPGNKLVQVDLKQAELWMVAWLSRDKKLLDMLGGDTDVHQFMADIVKLETGLEATRAMGKEINHATSYGMGPDKFARQLLKKCDIAINRAQAKEIIALRFREFPGIPQWQRDTEQMLKQSRVMVTPFGRKAEFMGRLDPELLDKALNFVPQSTVADALNMAWMQMLERDPQMVVLQQGHDSLLIETDNVEDTVATINYVFPRISFKLNGLNCVIPHEVEVGDNWRDMVEVK